ncbi:acyl--CoA ligase [Gordonia sp. TBRC 11910]|uniref:Acyl--CoA ligase n=1 Tax=Gordonia asplenii TaxID=2725283 RepID=A0A848KWM3_9ACTN|nr:class I adenylate-forming enzyme family protein [Gordonia asplenii]NMO03224.1 acyl--CoA ligase [Gordonia asplenii]
MGTTLNWITDSVAGQVPVASPEQPALAFEDQAPISYGELRTAEFRYATALQNAGVNRGDRVAILMRNCIEYAELFFAISRVGATAVRLNWRLTGEELRFLLDDSGSSLLILDAEFAERIDTVRDVLPAIHTYVARPAGGDVPTWAQSFDSFAQVDSIGTFPELDADDPVTIMYTSGTTGLPKGAVLTHGNLLWLASIQALMWKLDSTSVAQTSGPMFHAAALEICVLPAMLMHGTGIFLGSGGFTLDRHLEIGRKQGATLAFVYSHMLYELMRRDDLKEVVAPTLHQLVAGGDTVLPWIYDELEERLPGVLLDQTYGLTEGGMVCCLLKHSHARGHETSVGRPNPLGELEIRRPDGELVEIGEVGEIFTRNPGVSVGYWNRPEANAETFVEGWCRTGDLGRFDADGFMTLAGRAKDMVRSGGENIYPAEIEKVLAGHESVEDVAVVGVPDEKFVEVGAAILVASGEASIDVEAIRRYLADRLAKFKIPKYFVIVPELPRNASGKVLKHVLRAEYSVLGSDSTKR